MIVNALRFLWRRFVGLANIGRRFRHDIFLLHTRRTGLNRHDYSMGINASEATTGSYSSGSRELGFVYSGGAYTTLHFPRSSDTLGTGINRSGAVIGEFTNRTFLYSGGKYTRIY